MIKITKHKWFLLLQKLLNLIRAIKETVIAMCARKIHRHGRINMPYKINGGARAILLPIDVFDSSDAFRKDADTDRGSSFSLSLCRNKGDEEYLALKVSGITYMPLKNVTDELFDMLDGDSVDNHFENHDFETWFNSLGLKDKHKKITYQKDYCVYVIEFEKLLKTGKKII